MKKKDLHITFRVSQDMLDSYEALVKDISDKVGDRIPHSQILRAIIYILMRDGKTSKAIRGEVTDILKRNLENRI